MGLLDSLMLYNMYDQRDYTEWKTRMNKNFKVGRISSKQKFKDLSTWGRIKLAYEGFKTDNGSLYRYITNGLRGKSFFLVLILF